MGVISTVIYFYIYSLHSGSFQVTGITCFFGVVVSALLIWMTNQHDISDTDIIRLEGPYMVFSILPF